MSVLQYVGARYVPVFYKNPNGSWDWEAGVTYEPLTIVKYGENSYTSRSQVPSTVGSPNLNPDYWANTGNYNGITSILDERMTNVESILTHKKGFSPMMSCKALLVGDSYCTTVNGARPYSSYLSDVFSLYGGSLRVIGSGGSGLIGQPGTPTFNTLLSQVEDKDSYDLVIVQGFANDNTKGVADLQAAVSTLAGTLRKFVNAQILIAPVSKGIAFNYATTTRQICEICRQNSLPVDFALFHILTSTSEFQNDGVHPSVMGAGKISNYMNDVLNGCQVSYLYGVDISYASLAIIKVYRHPDTIELDFDIDALITIFGNLSTTSGSFLSIPAISLMNTWVERIVTFSYGGVDFLLKKAGGEYSIAWSGASLPKKKQGHAYLSLPANIFGI